MGQSDYFKAGSHNAICDICGFKFKIEQLFKTWDGYYACRVNGCWNPRQPQDFVRGVLDNQSVAINRPDQPEEFTTTAQDLEVWGSGPLAIPDFSATPLSGIAPLTVSFTNETTGTVNEYLWAFGDSETSTLTNPVHEYVDAGTYTVSLTATNNTGGASETKVGYITVSSVAPETNIISLTSTGTPTPFSIIAVGSDSDNAYGIAFEPSQVTWNITEATVTVYSNTITVSGEGDFQITEDGATARFYRDGVEIDSASYVNVGPYSQQAFFEGSPNTLTNIVIN